MALVYWTVFGFGAVLTAASFFLGDADADLDLDADADFDADADMDGGQGGFAFSALPFASLRFWMFFANTFGLTGGLLSLLGFPGLWTALIASITGTTLGYGAFQVFRLLAREQISGQVETRGYVGEEARVLLDVKPDARGKIVLETLAGRVELMARTGDNRVLQRGATVLVTSIREGEAVVTSLRP